MELRRPTRSENAPDAVDTTPAALCETMQRIAVYLSGSALISGSCSAGDALKQQRERRVLFRERAAGGRHWHSGRVRARGQGVGLQ